MEDESEYTSQFVPRFLNEEPVVLAGLTQSEFTTCIAIGGATGVVLTILVSMFVSLGTMIVLTFVLGAGIGGSSSMKVIRKMKVGKPRGYLSARIKVAGAAIVPQLFNGNGLYLKDHPLTVGRSKRRIIILK
jgi:conjugative transfer region protein (TIGR03750 family)